MMAAALLFRSRRLFCFLFFCKGFCVCSVLCVLSFYAVGALKACLPVFLLETLLPLPGMLLLGTVWYAETRDAQQHLWLAVSALLPAFIGLMLEHLIFP